MGAFDQPSAINEAVDRNARQQQIDASQQEQQRAQQMQPYKVQEAQDVNKANRLKQAVAQLDFSLQTLQGVNDQASYERWRNQMHANGIDTNGDPAVFDPAWKEQSMAQALSMKDQLGKYSATMVTGPNGELQSIPFNTRTGEYGAAYTMPAGTTLAAKPGAGPMGPQEFQYLQSLSPDDQEKYLQMKRGPKTVNLGGEIGVMGAGGNISQRYAKSAAPMPTMNPDDAAVITQAMAAGQIGLPTLSRNNPMGAKLIADALRTNPEMTGNQLINARRWDTGPLGNTVRSLGVVVYHSETLKKLVDAMANGDVKAANVLKNEYAAQTGNPAPTNFDAAKRIYADEIAKAILGGATALGDRESAESTINRAYSPAQLKGVMDTYSEMASAQLQGLQQQYEIGTQRTDFMNRLPEAARKSYAKFSAPPPALGAMAGQQTTLPTFTGPSDPAFIIAPSGTTFIDADTGKQKVKH
jgi:hypothetical protein